MEFVYTYLYNQREYNTRKLQWVLELKQILPQICLKPHNYKQCNTLDWRINPKMITISQLELIITKNREEYHKSCCYLEHLVTLDSC